MIQGIKVKLRLAIQTRLTLIHCTVNSLPLVLYSQLLERDIERHIEKDIGMDTEKGIEIDIIKVIFLPQRPFTLSLTSDPAWITHQDDSE